MNPIRYLYDDISKMTALGKSVVFGISALLIAIGAWFGRRKDGR